jgi:hypothetical protein
MRQLRFNGVLADITTKHPNLDLTDFLEDNLQLPRFKAEVLAARIEKQCFHQPVDAPPPDLRMLVEKPVKPEPPQPCTYAVETLSEKEFVHFMKWLLTEMDYTVMEQESVGLGIIFVVEKDGEKTAVLALKCSPTYRVTSVAVLVANEAMHNHGCHRGLVAATSDFSEQAWTDAEKAAVELWDRGALDSKIAHVIKKPAVAQSSLPPYQGSLLESLLRLDENKDFIIEPRLGGKYDLFLPGVKYPLLTFAEQGGVVVRCVFRIRNGEPVGEFEGEVLVGCEGDVRVGPDGVEAYGLVLEYLAWFLG